ncbi:WD40 repeat domain-containing protein [Lusitaniella coriacea]|uniref:WD40 repeat domain-containing protein n=1 Tax=Lusitaniella coriacea TaxID=1983105 RepID=UPI003CF4DE2E
MGSGDRTLASGSSDRTVRLWRVRDGNLLRAIAAHEDAVKSVSFSPDGNVLASASLDRTIALWDVATGRKRQTLMGHRSWVNDVAFSPDGNVLASASSDNAVKLWNVALDLDGLMELGCNWLQDYFATHSETAELESACQ